MAFKEQAGVVYKNALSFLRLLFRRLRLIRFNRDFLVFLVFLAISTGLWWLQTLKETTSFTQEYKLRIVGKPKNVIYTSEVPEVVKVNLQGSGYKVLSYAMKNDGHVLIVNYEDLENTSSKVIIDNSILKRNLARMLGSSIKIISVTPPQVDIYYTMGKAKTVPVKFVGALRAGLQHVLCDVKLLKDSAQVYAPLYLHDSILTVQTEKLFMKDIEDTTVVRVALKKIDHAVVYPDSVDVKICVDLFTEKTISVPIYSINCPANKVIRTFPKIADVTFRISATRYDAVTANDFLLVVDYKDVFKSKKFLKVKMQMKPKDASHIRIKPDKVDYVNEEEGE